MERRTFITRTAAASTLIGLGGLPLSSCRGKEAKRITILHTNDVHSHIDPFPRDHVSYPNLGGLARRASLVEQIRSENPNTLLLDAGDIFQGTPYFNFYGGELEFKLMSMLKYDAATIGNHDFDNGVNGLLAQMPHAKFKFVSANYDFTNTPLDTHVQPYEIFVRNGIRIGIFGLGIRLEGVVNKELYGETKYLNPIEIAQDMSRQLREDEQCDLVICLSHLGYEYDDREIPSDVMLAGNTQDIDLIIGGHTHTFLERPVVHKNRVGKEVLVNQVGCYGVLLGRVDFILEPGKETRAEGISIRV